MEKVNALAFVVLIVFLAILSCNQSTQLVKGDLNMDRIVTQADVDLLIEIAIGNISPTDDQMWAGDMNDDGVINSADVAILYRMINGTDNVPGDSS